MGTAEGSGPRVYGARALWAVGGGGEGVRVSLCKGGGDDGGIVVGVVGVACIPNF